MTLRLELIGNICCLVKVTIARPKSHLSSVALLNSNNSEGTLEIYFSVDFGAQKAVQGLEKEWREALVLCGDAIQALVIHAWVQNLFLLSHKKDGCSRRLC